MTDYANLSDRELDAAVAERVMGWTCRRERWLDHAGRDAGITTEFYASPTEGTITAAQFQPSKLIQDAWLVVERMRELGFGFRAYWFPNGGNVKCCFATGFDPYDSPEDAAHDVIADSAPRAICLAALAALES